MIYPADRSTPTQKNQEMSTKQHNWLPWPVRISGRFVLRRVADFSNHFSRESLYKYLDREIQLLNETPAKTRVLNVGAGGQISRHVARLNHSDLTTIDIDPDRGPEMVVDVCNMHCFRDGTFDFVFMMEVLEHVRDPHVALSEIQRVLKPGGKMLMSTPFVFEAHDVPHDYYRFTRFGLRYLLRDFASVEVHARNGYLKSCIVPVLRLYKSPYATDFCIGLMFMAIVFVLYPMIWLLDKVVRSDDATSRYVALCTKAINVRAEKSQTAVPNDGLAFSVVTAGTN